MFDFMKPEHVKKTEFVANSVSNLFISWHTGFSGPPIGTKNPNAIKEQLSPSKELMIYSGLIFDFYKELKKSGVVDVSHAYSKYISTHSKVSDAIKSGRVFGLQDVALQIIVENFGLKESPTMTLNRIIQIMYKNDLNRFAIEGRNYTIDDIESFYTEPMPREALI
ncbi:hypothetical protein ACVC7V_26210 [Hydrogenophaga sp. A37]|uniref:hypothetical protein n=1 Tax=Hydrogenophaga sp. A37 TaxID=1945864 RepID=UPI00117AA376|nr:hypothetical protein [Hydrogenophaga sp. A37]